MTPSLIVEVPVMDGVIAVADAMTASIDAVAPSADAVAPSVDAMAASGSAVAPFAGATTAAAVAIAASSEATAGVPPMVAAAGSAIAGWSPPEPVARVAKADDWARTAQRRSSASGRTSESDMSSRSSSLRCAISRPPRRGPSQVPSPSAATWSDRPLIVSRPGAPWLSLPVDESDDTRTPSRR